MLLAMAAAGGTAGSSIMGIPSLSNLRFISNGMIGAEIGGTGLIAILLLFPPDQWTEAQVHGEPVGQCMNGQNQWTL